MSHKATKRGGTIRQRSDGRWEARYIEGRDPDTGKQILRSVYGATQNEVRQKMVQQIINLYNGTNFDNIIQQRSERSYGT